jgi:hypothetical protein
MIGAVKASEVKVKLASGEVTAAKVTYPITFAANEFKAVTANEPPGQTPAIAAGDVFEYGHLQARPLVDDHYLVPGPSGPGTYWDRALLKPFVSPSTNEPSTCYIYQTDGDVRTPSAVGAADDRPSYMFFRSQDRIDFSTFLQA